MDITVEIIIALVLISYLVWKIKSKKKQTTSKEEEQQDLQTYEEKLHVVEKTSLRNGNKETKNVSEDLLPDTHAESSDAMPHAKYKHFNPNSPRIPEKIPQHSQTTKEDFKKFAGMRILVAEDNLINQKVIAGLLNESGIELVFANDGMEALSLLNNQHDFDLILMDAHMPNMDGFAATRKIRENQDFENLPVVALSGDVASDDIKKMYDVGMDAHLEKPLKMDALYEVFEAFAKKNEPTYSSADTTTILDTQEGIRISGGDKEFYKEILKEFLQEYSNAHNETLHLLEEDKREKADALLLDISGITANIGAKETHQIAMQLKEQLLKKAPQEEILQTAQAFVDAYENLLLAINRYLD